MTQAETEAFLFGPTMRRLANLFYGGRLSTALTRHATPDREARHWETLRSMRGPIRRDYAEAVMAAEADAGA